MTLWIITRSQLLKPSQNQRKRFAHSSLLSWFQSFFENCQKHSPKHSQASSVSKAQLGFEAPVFDRLASIATKKYIRKPKTLKKLREMLELILDDQAEFLLQKHSLQILVRSNSKLAPVQLRGAQTKNTPQKRARRSTQGACLPIETGEPQDECYYIFDHNYRHHHADKVAFLLRRRFELPECSHDQYRELNRGLKEPMTFLAFLSPERFAQSEGSARFEGLRLPEMAQALSQVKLQQQAPLQDWPWELQELASQVQSTKPPVFQTSQSTNQDPPPLKSAGPCPLEAEYTVYETLSPDWLVSQNTHHPSGQEGFNGTDFNGMGFNGTDFNSTDFNGMDFDRSRFEPRSRRKTRARSFQSDTSQDHNHSWQTGTWTKPCHTTWSQPATMDNSAAHESPVTPALHPVLRVSKRRLSQPSTIQNLAQALAKALRSGRHTAPLIQANDHMLQGADHNGHNRWILFDDLWAKNNPDLAFSILYSTERWDLLS